MPYSLSLADAAAVVVIVYLAKRFLSRANTISSLPLPPGPPGLPLIGNALDIPQTEPHKVYMEWAQKYGASSRRYSYTFHSHPNQGPIMHVSVLSQPLIIVNDLVIATELLVRRATNSSERPTLTMAGRLSGWNSLTGLMPYGAEWRTRRRHLNTAIGAHTIKSRHSALLGRAAQQMVLRLMRAPNKLDESVRALAGGVILKITYGYEAQEEHDPLVELVGGAMNYFNRLTESNQVWMVDLFPIRSSFCFFLAVFGIRTKCATVRHVPAWLPGAGFQRTASESMKMAQKMAQVPFDTVTAQMVRSAHLLVAFCSQNNAAGWEERVVHGYRLARKLYQRRRRDEHSMECRDCVRRRHGYSIFDSYDALSLPHALPCRAEKSPGGARRCRRPRTPPDAR